MSGAPERRADDGCCGDAAIYLLGLLDERQAGEFLAHARGCAVCGDELAALAPAVDLLPATVPQFPAPAQVKRRVMAVVRDEARCEPQPPMLEARPSALRRWRDRERSWLRSRRLLPAFAGAALLIIGATVGALITPLGSDGSHARTVSAQVSLAGATATLHQSGGHAWLTVTGMPQPRHGRVYEVWVRSPGGVARPTSSLFTPTTSGAASAEVPDKPGGAREVMVTQEPAGGSSKPTGPVLLVARMA